MGYIDKVLSLAPTEHYTLSETSGTTVFAVRGHNMTWNGGTPIAYNVAGSIAGSTGGVQTGTAGVRARVTSATWFQQPIGTANIWFKTVSSGSILAMCEMRNPDYWAIWKNSDDKIRALVWTGGTTVDISGVGPTVNDGNWHMVTLTWSDPGGSSGSTAGILYLDGIQIGTHTPSNNVAYVFTGELTLGAENDNGRIFVGSLDEFSLFPTALSAADIRGLYNEASRNAVILG